VTRHRYRHRAPRLAFAFVPKLSMAQDTAATRWLFGHDVVFTPHNAVSDETASAWREGGTSLSGVVVLGLAHVTFPFQEVPTRWSQELAERNQPLLDAVLASGSIAFAHPLSLDEPPAKRRLLTLACVRRVATCDSEMQLVAVCCARAVASGPNVDKLDVDELVVADVVTLPDIDVGPPPESTTMGLAIHMVDPRSLATRLCEQPAVALLVRDPSTLRRRFESPTELSYWASEHLPLSLSQRREILQAGSTSTRLRLLLTFAKTMGSMVCSSCGQQWAHASELLSLQAHGDGASYVNRHGFNHSLVCLRSTLPSALLLIGRPCPEDCWFKGYAWTIVQCVTCHTHAGWKYTWAKREGEQGELAEFWGLRVGSFEQRSE